MSCYVTQYLGAYFLSSSIVKRRKVYILNLPNSYFKCITVLLDRVLVVVCGKLGALS